MTDENQPSVQLTADNFMSETGKRFRINNKQKARIELTKLTTDERQELSEILKNCESEIETDDQMMRAFGLKKYARWLNEVPDVLFTWNDDTSPLTREGAFKEFMNSGGLDRLLNQKPEIPDEVFLDDDLTFENFEDKVEAAIGVKKRFRVSRDQHARIKEGTLTREEAFQEMVAQIRAKQYIEQKTS